jgi:hypothetical protein
VCTVAFTGIGYTLTVLALSSRSPIMALGAAPAEMVQAAAD